MSIRMPARVAGSVLISVITLLALALPAAAHVFVADGSSVPAGGDGAVIHFRVPHGCDGQATTAVSVQLPEGVVGAKPELIPGWTATTTMVPATYTLYGTDYTERVGTITWEGGPLPNDQFMDFGVSANFRLEPGEYHLPVVQSCGTTTVSWIEIPAAGQSEDDVEHPAPAITVVAGGEDDPHGSGSGDSTDMSAQLTAAEARITALEQQSTTPDPELILGVVALVVGVVGLGLGAMALRRRA